MSRWVLSNRRAGKFSADAKASSFRSFEEAEKRLRERSSDEGTMKVLTPARNAGEASGRRVLLVEAPAGEIEDQKRRLPSDVIVEPEILHYPTVTLPLHIRNVFAAAAINSPDLAGSGDGLELAVKEFRGGVIEGVTATLFLRGPSGYIIQQSHRTSDRGTVEFRYASIWKPVSLMLVPAYGYWAKFVRAPSNNAVIYLVPLPKPAHPWWHASCGSTRTDLDHGAGVRVGVIDTGCGVHPGLSHVSRVGAYTNKTFDPGGAGDVEQHGTHVTGIIAGRRFGADDSHGWSGISPGAEVFTVRVFPSAGSGASQADIALAIDHLSNKLNVDIINLSLGSELRSEICLDSIQDALERGTICICAAGNSGLERVQYPAAFEECVAVSALGMEGWEPPESISGMNYPDDLRRYSYRGFYVASFSCWGEEIDCAAPGVGIIGPVPVPDGCEGERCYSAFDGTSMAAPAVTATLAARLSTRQADYLSLPRDLTRAQQARDILRRYCRDLGLIAKLQGRGVPQLT